MRLEADGAATWSRRPPVACHNAARAASTSSKTSNGSVSFHADSSDAEPSCGAPLRGTHELARREPADACKAVHAVAEINAAAFVGRTFPAARTCNRSPATATSCRIRAAPSAAVGACPEVNTPRKPMRISSSSASSGSRHKSNARWQTSSNSPACDARHSSKSKSSDPFGFNAPTATPCAPDSRTHSRSASIVASSCAS